MSTGLQASSSDIDAPHPAPPQPPEGWYTDPGDSAQWRWWAGDDWKEHRAPRDPNDVAHFVPRGQPASEQAAASTPSPQSMPRNDLRHRVPAQSLIEHMIRLRDEGKIERSHDGRRVFLTAETRSWYDGALGERHVARILDHLGPEWTVLHSVPVGNEGSDIDHVLIGPPGVYTINTKHHAGKSVWVAGRALRVNNHPQHYISNAAFEARRAEKLLTAASGLAVEAAGLVVLVGARQLTVKAAADGGDIVVGVVRDTHLLETLQSRRIYSDEQVRRIADAAAQPGTWTSTPAQPSDPQLLAEEFDALERSVNAGGSLDQPSGTAGRRSSTPRARTSRPQRAIGQRSGSRRPSRKRRALVSELIKLALVAIVVIAGINYVNSRVQAPASTPAAFASAQEEQTALAQTAGTASVMIDQLSPEGVRPTSLTLSAGSTLDAPDGTVLVELPAGSSASYVPSADGLTYSLTLTGPQFGTIVTLTPEAGVVPGPLPAP